MDKAGRPFLNTGLSLLSSPDPGTCASVSAPAQALCRGRAYLSQELQARLSPGLRDRRLLHCRAPGKAPASQASFVPAHAPHSHWTTRLVSKVTFSNRVLGPPQAGTVVAWSSKDIRELLVTARAGCSELGCAAGWPRAAEEPGHSIARGTSGTQEAGLRALISFLLQMSGTGIGNAAGS